MVMVRGEKGMKPQNRQERHLMKSLTTSSRISGPGGIRYMLIYEERGKCIATIELYRYLPIYFSALH
jgi:hypothetical protein